jgi:hypothetical protein
MIRNRLRLRRIKMAKWAVVYVGTPVGIGELGIIVSQHRTEEAAMKARQKLQNNPKYYGSNSVVKNLSERTAKP